MWIRVIFFFILAYSLRIYFAWLCRVSFMEYFYTVFSLHVVFANIRLHICLCLSDCQYLFLFVWLNFWLFVSFLICQLLRSYWQFVLVRPKTLNNNELTSALLPSIYTVYRCLLRYLSLPYTMAGKILICICSKYFCRENKFWRRGAWAAQFQWSKIKQHQGLVPIPV